MKPNNARQQTDRPVGYNEPPNLPARPSAAQPLLERAGTAPASSYDEQHVLATARQEAEALAWTTPFPFLFLPVLIEEKVHQALAIAAKQRQVTRQTSQLWTRSTRPAKRLRSGKNRCLSEGARARHGRERTTTPI